MQPEQKRFFDALYEECYLSLLHQAEKKMGDPVLAQDITQDTFCALLNRIDHVMAHENPQGWLNRVLKFKIIRFFEKRAREQKLFLNMEEENYVEPSQPDERIQAMEAEGGEMMDKIQESLTEEEYRFITRLVLEKASHQELSKEYHITEIGSKKKRERIIRKLNKKFPEFSEKIGQKDEKEKV